MSALPQPMTAASTRLYTWAEYLALERTAETRHEFIPVTRQSAGGPVLGRLVAMAGATRDHVLVAGNIKGELRQALKGEDCVAFESDLKVRLPDGRGVYPDVVVVCGKEEYEPREEDDRGRSPSPLVLLNPTIIIEVLSESTADYDRGEKFRAYRELESLREYHLVSPDGTPSDRFVRNETGWKIDSASASDPALPFESIGVDVPMSEVYRSVTLPVTE